jgi:hypothetical protein
MDRNSLAKLIKAQAKVGGMVNANELVDEALNLAGPFVWGVHPWKFTRVEDTLTTTASTEYVALPSDFGGYRSLRYRNGSTEGWKLRYYAEDSYELYFPNPDILTDDEPKVCKIVWDSDNGEWRAYFTPIPDSAYDLTLIYSRKFSTFDTFPEGFENLLQAAAWLFMYPKGTTQAAIAQRTFNRILKQTIDDIDPAHRARTDVVRRSTRFKPHDGIGDYSDPAHYFNYDWTADG